MSYNFDTKLISDRGHEIGVDTQAEYGYWFRTDGSEGGGLWFKGRELIDYDGAYALPKSIAFKLIEAGFNVGKEFYED